MANLNTKAFGGFFFLLLVMAALLFLPAWTLDYRQGWAFLAVFGVSALAITLYLMKKDPKLLERRVHAGPTAEKETSQKIIQSITALGFMAMLVLPALDHRFHWWPAVPFFASVAGDVLVAIGFPIIFFVYKENTFALGNYRGLSRTESGLFRTLLTRASPDVYGRLCHVRRRGSLARLVVGTLRVSPHDARIYMENL
jgi:hypothetical protein